MNTRNILTLIAFGGAVALVACSSTEEDKFASSDAFCDARSEAYCNGLAKKCASTVDACKATQKTKCSGDVNTATGQGRTYKSNNVQDCIDSINNTYRSGGSEITVASELETDKICARVFSGSRKESETCEQTYQCEGSLICDKGVCIKEDKVSLKGQCNNAGQVCETGTYCQQQGATKFCVESNKLNETCKADAPCIETLRCVTGSCVARVTAGNPCDTDSECAPEAPVCDAKKCRPKYESTTAKCKEFGAL